MEKVTLFNKTFVKYILEKDIEAATARVARQINEDYRDEVPLVLVTLTGAMFFAVDLMKHFSFIPQVSCIKLSSYKGTECTNTMTEIMGLREDVKDRRVLVVEDIVDTGKTYLYMYKMLMDKGAKDVRIATMTIKRDAYRENLPIDYVGLEVPDKFVIGHGLDIDGFGRNLRDIYQLEE